jgi:ABC-type antimicrobial peptide transport system permease subunit
MVLALVLALTIGVTFGLLPADTAAKLNPSEVFRYE